MGRPQPLKTTLSNEGKLKLTKIEAAVFQLETAIELWFNDAPAVSVVSLLYSSHEILYQLNKNNPNKVLSLADPPTTIKLPEQWAKEWNSIFKLDHNFSKHSGYDPMESHFITVRNLQTVIIDAVRMYAPLGFAKRQAFENFTAWTFTSSPELFRKNLVDLGLDPRIAQFVVSKGKKNFFDSYNMGVKNRFAVAGTPVLKA